MKAKTQGIYEERKRQFDNFKYRNLDQGERVIDDISTKVMNTTTTKALSLKDLSVVAKSITPFKGGSSDNVVVFLRQVSTALDGLRINNEELVRLISSKLQEGAHRWYYNLSSAVNGNRERLTSKQLLDALRAEYLNPETKARAARDLTKLIQRGQKGSVDEFFGEFTQLAEIATPLGETAASQFILGLNDDLKASFRIHQMSHRITSLEEAYRLAKLAESLAAADGDDKNRKSTTTDDKTKEKDKKEINTIEQAEEVMREKQKVQQLTEQLAKEQAVSRYVGVRYGR